MPDAKPDNVDYLPVWKKGATAEDRFLGLAMMARKNPERFRRVVVVYQEQTGEGKKSPTRTRYVSGDDMNTTEVLGVLELGKLEILRYTHQF